MTELHVTDLSRSIAWYRDKLALTLILHDEANNFALLEDQQSGRLALKQSSETTTNVLVHFNVQNLDATVNALSQRGVAISTIKQSDEGYRAVTIHDPDSIAVTLFEWM